MSFTEVMHWGALALALLASALYTVLAWGASSVAQLGGALFASVLVLTVVVVVYAIVVAIAMAIRSGGEVPLSDRRDDEIEAGAMPYAFAVLMVGVVLTIGAILVDGFGDRPFDPVVTLNILLATLFGALVVGSAVTLVRYRVGIR